MLHDFSGVAGPDFAPSSAVKLSPEPIHSILLADDDPDIRSLTRTFLEHAGFRVYSTGDAVRAAQIFRKTEKIDLLITDQFMPGRSGMELALELKALRRDLPVLMISGGVLEAAEREQLRTEGWRFLAKPFSLPSLLNAVHEILRPNAEPEAMRDIPKATPRTIV